MSQSENKKKKEQLEREFEQLQNEQPDFQVTQYLVKEDDLPGFGNLQIYDYETDVISAEEEATKTVENLIDLFIPEIKDHPYILNKSLQDSNTYANSIFINKMTRKLFIKQMQQIDNGDVSARMYEVSLMGIKEIRENSKDLRLFMNELEQNYKDLRNDLGLNEIKQQNSTSSEDSATEDDNTIIKNSKLNDKIDELLKSRKGS